VSDEDSSEKSNMNYEGVMRWSRVFADPSGTKKLFEP